MWGVLTVSGPHWVCPAYGVYAFPVYTAQSPGCSAGELSEVDLGLRALPRSKPLRFRFLGTSQRRRLCWAVFCALPMSEQLRQPGAWQAQSLQVGGAFYHLPHPSRLVFWVRSAHAFSGVLCVSSGELISGCDPPSKCRLSRIPRSLG